MLPFLEHSNLAAHKKILNSRAQSRIVQQQIKWSHPEYLFIRNKKKKKKKLSRFNTDLS